VVLRDLRSIVTAGSTAGPYSTFDEHLCARVLMMIRRARSSFVSRPWTAGQVAEQVFLATVEAVVSSNDVSGSRVRESVLLGSWMGLDRW